MSLPRPIRIVFRILAGALAILLILPLIWLGAALLPAARIAALPPDEIAIAGLTAPVEIAFSTEAVPTIRAETMADALAALGYLHARERLFSMELTRRLGAGRTAEIIGAPGVTIDRLMRTLSLYRHAERDYAALKPESRAFLDAYVAGVNAYLSGPDYEAPLEFRLLLHEPEPWVAADSLVWLRLMALQLGSSWRGELARAAVLDRLGEDGLNVLYPPYPDSAPFSLSGTLQDGVDWRRMLAAAPPPIGPNRASNAWALAGSRTDTGTPILASDPHLGLSAPIQWYLVRIETPEATLAGGSFPPSPFVLGGHNGKAAWGLTTTGGDVQDLVIERLDPEAPEQRYLVPGGSAPFETRTEIVRVRFGAPQEIVIRETRNGPVMSDIDDDMAAAAGENHVMALRWADGGPGNSTADALFAMAAASDWASFRDAMRSVSGPLQNVHFASVDGSIGMIVPGKVPLRSRGDGRLPVTGWSGEDEWLGLVPFEEMPQRRDPAAGVVMNANNAVVGPDFPHLITADWANPYRGARLDALIDSKQRHSLADNQSYQLDTVSEAARSMVPLMTAIEPETAELRQAVKLLEDWNFSMQQDLAAPLIFRAWMHRLGPALWDDELGELADGYRGRPQVIRGILEDHRRWCDRQDTEIIENCATILTRTLDDALSDLAAHYGPEIDSWRWGDAHRAPLAHPLLGRIPGLDLIADIGVEIDGGDYTVLRAASFGGDGTRFDAVHGSGLRAVIDLADPDRSLFMIATGQSGNPFSPHFGDLAPRWAAGDYLAMPGDAPGAHVVRAIPAD